MHDECIAADRRDRKPVVVFLHGSASSPRQWQPYMQRFALRYRAVAPPLIGYEPGSHWRPESPWNPRGTVSLEREAALLEPWLYLAAEGAHLAGHSYGAAVALHAALRYPGRVRSVVVYEPVLFNLLASEPGARREAGSIRALSEAVKRYCAAGDFAASARVFVDYWSGYAYRRPHRSQTGSGARRRAAAARGRPRPHRARARRPRAARDLALARADDTVPTPLALQRVGERRGVF
jgi:pimeloyl-ACP methyl ester carboxylesterase